MRSNLAALLVLLLIALAGCSASPQGESVLAQPRQDRKLRDGEFWYELANDPIATNDDAFHGLLLAIDGADPCSSFDERVQTLKERRLLPAGFNQSATQAVERGTVAVALVKSLKLRVGLTMSLFGNSPRYAVRELESRGLYPESSPQQIFSGPELVGVISKLQTYTEGNPDNYPATVLYPGADQTPIPEAMDDAPVTPVLLSISAANLSLQPDQPSTAQSLALPEDALKIVILAVRGSADFRLKKGDDWQEAKPGQALAENAQLRTSYKSAVQIQIVPDQTVTLDQLGVLTINRATLTSGKFTVRLSMPHGSTRMLIESANREYDSSVSSPNATLGIRGTRVSLVDQRPFPPEAVSLTGQAEFQNIRRQLVSLGRRGQGKTKIVGADTSAAQFALTQAVVDPTYAPSRTQSEQPLIASLISQGAVFEFNRELGIPVVHGGIPPAIHAPASELIPLLPGQLTFVLRWHAPNVDLNIAVQPPPTPQSPAGEFLFTAPGLVQTASGGRIPFDHRGGAHGGIEVAYWQSNTYPTGIYSIVGTNQSAQPSLARIDAFLNGKPLPVDPLTQLPQEQTAFPSGESDAIVLFDVPPGNAASTAGVSRHARKNATPAGRSREQANPSVKLPRKSK